MMRIIVSGGLGNQMFQYALYLALKEKGRKVTLDTSMYSQVKMHNGYELEKCFGIKTRRIIEHNLGLFKLRLFLKIKPRFLFYNDKLFFDERVFSTKCKYLSGYWQSEKYFVQIENIIRKAFSFQDIDEQNRKLAKEMNSCTSISIHIRRGDYGNNKLYTDLSKTDYYFISIKYLTEQVVNKFDVNFYLFSDDLEFSTDFLKKIGVKDIKRVDINKGENSYKDMFLMSNCKHNIIANSSFSWWGAWLNENPEKIVIAPSRWFNTDNENYYKDIVPNSWIKI